jgi:membrane-associated phospholipid phosphatase
MILTPSGWVMVAFTALLISSANGFAEPPFDSDLKLSGAADEQDDSSPGRKLYLLSYDTTNSPMKYLEWLWKDPINLVTRPYYWRAGEWTTFGIEAGITGALFPLDDPVRDSVQDNYSSSFNSSLNTVRDITGSGAYFFAAGGALFGSGFIVHNEKLADSGFLAVESAAYAGGLAESIKFLTGRERPSSGKNQYQFHGPSSGGSGSSFVSGESTVAFAFASSVSEVWQNPWVTWPLYTFAGAVAAQRVYDNRHWLSDVVGGAFLGHVVGKNIVRFHYRRDTDGVLQPYFTKDTVGGNAGFTPVLIGGSTFGQFACCTNGRYES